MQFLLKIAIIVLLVFETRASEPVNSEFGLIEVANGIYVHGGRNVEIDHADRDDSAKIGFIVGQQCVAVVDSGGSLKTGRALLAAIRAHTAVPICYVINTHVHFDHVLGNAAFIEEGVEFIGHQNLASAVTSNRAFFYEHFARELDGAEADLVIGPTKTVSGSMTLNLGKRKLILEAHQTAHTNADLSVFDENTRTLWTGDLVFIDRLPILDGSLKGWLDWIEEYQAKSLARIIPGHGPTSAEWPSGADAERDYLTVLLTEARTAIGSGMFLEDAIETLARDVAAKWTLSEFHRRNVSRAFRELEWE